MKGLMCTTGNCEHNRSCHCHAGIVNFDKHGACRTKQKRGGVLPSSPSTMIEAARDFDYGEDTEVLVQCDCVGCAYNRNRVCANEAINVGDTMLRTKCYTKRAD